MPEGYLCTRPASGGYVIDCVDGPAITSGQAIEIFVGGYWIAGHIASSSSTSGSSSTDGVGRVPQHYGASVTGTLIEEDTVTEASEESFPASDPPAWTANPHKSLSIMSNAKILDGYYFVASADGSICGLCIGMKVRTR